MHVVLVEPEIPPNTGNVARLCAATRTALHLVEPFGFQLDDAQLKRAGMDYWRHVEWHRWRSWTEFKQHTPPGARLWFIESSGPRLYTEAVFGPGDYLVFGRETAGLPPRLGCHAHHARRLLVAGTIFAAVRRTARSSGVREPCALPSGRIGWS